jgi:3-oxoacyl-[acyl-carrier-protein] synthase III
VELTDPADVESPLPAELEEDELELVVPVAVEALARAPEGDEAETPGIVSALTVPKMPTPATAAKAVYAVTWLSSDSARSRARILSCAGFVFSMVIRLSLASQSSL